ncbi:hypothetical protein SeMB42_g01814 [Synchytrium endobioticum]|uniref:Uncharacterized protein n=1 Tax=Synchytrium endobioticum TaxID=286115 RepID=A0A507DJS3_9FUNG|nr:hypothetical protein SeMB42_g01814 [Synchytrium endobioticum]
MLTDSWIGVRPADGVHFAAGAEVHHVFNRVIYSFLPPLRRECLLSSYSNLFCSPSLSSSSKNHSGKWSTLWHYKILIIIPSLIYILYNPPVSGTEVGKHG